MTIGPISLGVLALQGDVEEHIDAARQAVQRLCMQAAVRPVRTTDDLRGVRALIIPGGESTTLHKLCEREGMMSALRRVPNIWGTCAGAIMLAKRVRGAAPGQRTLALMDITADRNAYGSQISSFEADIATALGPVHAVFIRAPKIAPAGKAVRVLARYGGAAVACEERRGGAYYLATAFHPELSSPLFHEHFLRAAAMVR